MQPALAPAPHPSMQSTAQDHADQVLHDQLLAAQHHLPGPRHQGGPSPQQHMAPSTASPRDQANIDPAISGAAMMGAAPPQTPTQPQQGSPESVSPKTYGKRELSTSKRAAQNRAAQRAFRQRKETYIRKLEDENKNIESFKDTMAKLVNENYSLRDYVINLQSRLMEAQIDVPDLPPNIDLTQNPRHDLALAGLGAGTTNVSASGPQQAQHPGSVNDDMNSLNRIAVAGLGMRKHPDETNFMTNNFQQNKRPRVDEGTTDPDLVGKQEGHPHGLPMA
ncbi:uncharacterized protein N7484_008068 [Penicillium longicatenatum]|uniref:uncharacterized protein n=1 Tax=Penicillium longicatenatum TaxID=1561947 RepID=UPI002547FA26|nr:uncharacterized protein N7484_008068 [Penicillium longicatenatum]KAJ5640206.1 hypothetical protein N7484_008068 [Penicillium longicatenatum]